MQIKPSGVLSCSHLKWMLRQSERMVTLEIQERTRLRCGLCRDCVYRDHQVNLHPLEKATKRRQWTWIIHSSLLGLIDREYMPIALVGSQSIYYDDCGSGHPVLLISGLGASRFMWWKQIEIFSRKHRLINMDNRDAGDSAPGTGPYTIADMADDAAGLIRNLNCGPTYVIGLSMGGFIALELSLRHPGLVGKLILVATSAGGSAYIPPAHKVGVLLMPNEKENLETLIRRVYPFIAAPGYMNSHPEDLDRVVRYSKSKPMSLSSYQRQLGATMTWPGMVDRMSRISLPTLVVHGAEDPLVPYGNGLYLSTIIRGAKLLTYANVGHLPPIEASERFNQDAMEFLG